MTHPPDAPNTSYMPGHVHTHVHAPGAPAHGHGATDHRTAAVMPRQIHSVLGWPAWQRMLAVLPVLLLLWLAVWWAGGEITPW